MSGKHAELVVQIHHGSLGSVCYPRGGLMVAHNSGKLGELQRRTSMFELTCTAAIGCSVAWCLWQWVVLFGTK